MAKLYIGNVDKHTDKRELETEFAKFGALREVWVARHPPGFAFVEFEDDRDAEDAIREMDDRNVCGSRIRVEWAKSNGRKPPPRDRGGFGGSKRKSRSRSPPPRKRRSPPPRRRSPSPRRRSNSPKRSSPRRSPRRSASPRRAASRSPRRSSPDREMYRGGRRGGSPRGGSPRGDSPRGGRRGGRRGGSPRGGSPRDESPRGGSPRYDDYNR